MIKFKWFQTTPIYDAKIIASGGGKKKRILISDRQQHLYRKRTIFGGNMNTTSVNTYPGKLSLNNQGNWQLKRGRLPWYPSHKPEPYLASLLLYLISISPNRNQPDFFFTAFLNSPNRSTHANRLGQFVYDFMEGQKR